MVGNKLIESQRASLAAINFNITTDIIGLHIIVDEAPEVVVYEENDSEGETDYLVDEVNVPDIDR